jgi:aerobic-type carbon monoxide dehydrogenase small subunit (CoxS/CutS family)
VSDTRDIRVTVNGRAADATIPTRMLLVDFIRHELGLYGTHVGCEQGGCGACTVLLNGVAIKSCLMLAVQADGQALMTVEGLAGSGPLHAVQEAFRDSHGLQCGFCTPGFLMNAVALAATGRKLERAELRSELAGNLCRCTGYQNIIDAVERFLDHANGSANGG